MSADQLKNKLKNMIKIMRHYDCQEGRTGKGVHAACNDMELPEVWGYDWYTGEEINLITHCSNGSIAYDELANYVSAGNLNVILSARKAAGKSGKGDAPQNAVHPN